MMPPPIPSRSLPRPADCHAISDQPPTMLPLILNLKNFKLNYHDSGCEKNVLSKFGHWDMMNKDFSIDHVLPQLILKPEHVERALKPHYQDAMNILKPKDNELDRLIVILPDNNGSLNGDLKRICETDLRSV
ncbi:hypothetical protein GUJ93_ZPchr0012g20649 [Zizania palustris]|uniref:Uncharacterized protein n=1 Tax=Zizania palustris TaxID=103762 RepID=A0A8J6BX52_ZIZPA|nr:hypothetical protein GUJ93_ZPchr0012g20649 [Zizania palustris]